MTWDLTSVPTEYNRFWEEPLCILIPALQHYCTEGYSFDTPNGWQIQFWKLKQGYPFSNDKRMKRMSGLEALERLENLVKEYPSSGRMKEGPHMKLSPALVAMKEKAAENQKKCNRRGDKGSKVQILIEDKNRQT
jgi:hypothetical protein